MNTTDALLMAAFGGKKTVIIPRKAINLLDIKGNVFKAYEKAEFLRLTELPAPPSADGFTPKGWNWTLPEAKAAVEANGTLDVAPTYETSDGKTRIYITLYEGRQSPYFGIAPNGSVDIDWGDGSEHSTLTGTSLEYTGVKRLQHTYPAPGEYVITLEVTGEASIRNVSSWGTDLFGKNTNTQEENAVYAGAVNKVDVGSNVIIGAGAFNNCRNLQTVSIPPTVTTIGSGAFFGCYSLKSISIPKGVTIIPHNAFRECHALSSVSFSSAVTAIGYSAFDNCYSLQSVNIPSGITSIDADTFNCCHCLAKVDIPSGVTSIAKNAFSKCYGLKEIHVRPTTPPTLAGSSSFGLSSDCIIYVPAESIDDYKTAQYWSSKESYIFGEGIPSGVVGDPITAYRSDYDDGYVNSGKWFYYVDNKYCCDIYQVDAGQKYSISLGDVVDNRFRVMFTTVDVTTVTQDVVGTSIVHLDDPAPGVSAIYTAPENGYIIIQKTNQGTTGIETIVYKMSA